MDPLETLTKDKLMTLMEGDVIDVTFAGTRPSQNRRHVPCMVLRQQSSIYLRVAVPSNTSLSVSAKNLYYCNLGTEWTAKSRS